MNQDINLHCFPKRRDEALAMLYLQNQDLSDKTPSDIHTMYWHALFEFRNDYEVKKEQGFFNEL